MVVSTRLPFEEIPVIGFCRGREQVKEEEDGEGFDAAEVH